MIRKPRNPNGTIFGIGYENPGYPEEFKFKHTHENMPYKTIKNFLSEDEIAEVKDSILKTGNPKTFLKKARAQRYIVKWELPFSIKEKVEAGVLEHTGEQWVVADFAFCKYEKIILEDGTVLNPELKMHRDENFDTQRLTLDYQLESNTSWDVIVDRELCQIEDNSALLFASTDQYHGRPPKEFLDGEYIDLIFFHLSKDGIPDGNQGQLKVEMENIVS